jgi:hypothetical protein
LGQRQYKFVEDQLVALRHTNLIGATHQIPAVTIEGISWTPSDEMTMVTGAFCSTLEVTDIRYDLSVYEEFLKEIQRSFGANAIRKRSYDRFCVSSFVTAVSEGVLRIACKP